MPTFSQRMGFVPIRYEPQVDELDDETRMALWNRLHTAFEALEKLSEGRELLDSAFKRVWRVALQRDLQKYTYGLCRVAISYCHQENEWHEVLTLVEVLVESINLESDGTGERLGSVLNEDVLSKFSVGYRFVGTDLTPITSDAEVDTVNTALRNDRIGSSARSHLQKAVELLSARENPNYRKAMAEAIDAVESVVHELTGDRVLSRGLKTLKRGEGRLHPALAEAWEKMYAWSSDEGVRHADFGSAPKDQALATYVVVTSSAFLNYLAAADNISVASK